MKHGDVSLVYLSVIISYLVFCDDFQRLQKNVLVRLLNKCNVYSSCGIIKSQRRQGRTHPLVDATIIGGGKRTGPETGPWVVSIGYHDENGYNHVCSGAILTRTVIITAAHCVAKSFKGFVKINQKGL